MRNGGAHDSHQHGSVEHHDDLDLAILKEDGVAVLNSAGSTSFGQSVSVISFAHMTGKGQPSS